MNYSLYSAEIQIIYQKCDVKNCMSDILEQDNQETTTENITVSTGEGRK